MASNSLVKTRSTVKTKLTEFVGPGKDFLISEVPTWRSIIQQGINLRDKKLIENSVSKNLYSVNDMCDDLANMVQIQWQKANSKFIPPITVGHRSVSRRIQTKWMKVNKLSSFKYSEQAKKEMTAELDTLCDITVCTKHPIYLCESSQSKCTGCDLKAHTDCDCESKVKIPKVELHWLYFQRAKTSEVSKIQISAVDIKDSKKETQKVINAEKRKEVQKALKRKEESEKADRFKKVKLCAQEIDSSDSDESVKEEPGGLNSR